MPYKHFIDNSGGLQNRTSRFLQKDNEWDIIVNGHTDEIGALWKRPGFKKVGGTVQAGRAIFGIGDGGTYLYAGMNDTTGTAGQLLKYNNSATAPITGTWTTVTGGTGVPVDVYPVFTPVAEAKLLIIAGSKVSPTAQADYMVTMSATYAAPQTTADVQYAPRSRHAIRFRDRIYHGNCAKNSNWTTSNWYGETVETKPNRIIQSNAPSAGAITYENQGVSGYSNFYDMDDDCTGLGVNNDQLLGFTRRSMWILSGDATLSWKNRYRVGCASGRTVKNVDIYTMWLSDNGFEAYAGGKPELISNKIKPIIDNVADKTVCFSTCHDEDHYRTYVGTLTIGGRSFKNCVIQYTLSTNSWTVYSYRVPTATTDTITSMGSFDNGTTTNVYFGTSNGQIYIMSEPGDSTVVYSDGDQTNETYDISFWARTPKRDYGTPHELKSSVKLIVYSENAQSTKVNVLADSVMSNGQPEPIGEIHNEIDMFTIDPPQAYWHQYEFTENSQRRSLKINGYTVNFSQSSNFVK